MKFNTEMAELVPLPQKFQKDELKLTSIFRDTPTLRPKAEGSESFTEDVSSPLVELQPLHPHLPLSLPC